MDEDISTWILEFLLRQPLDERIIDGVLSSLPLRNGDNRLKKTLLLRKIEFEASNASISEKVLDFLEIIEEINHREGKSASDSMKEAYCAVAVDCTVRFLVENLENNGKYLEAVQRIWRERVSKMEGLASDSSKEMMDLIEAAVWDSDASGRLLTINTRNEARKSLRVYLSEAWGILGLTFLELVAQKVGNALEELRSNGAGGPMAGPSNPSPKATATGETQKVRAPLRRKHVARRKGAKICDAVQGGEDEPMGKSDDGPAPETERLSAVPSKIESVAKILTRQETLATPEVERAQEALRSTSRELHAAVKDPLPEALQTAQTLLPTVAANTSRHNLMEPNHTAHTFEWDDSIDNSPGESSKRPRLPSPRASKPSPLKSYEDTKFNRRRVRKKWTPEEEDALRAGVKTFGKGSWKFILHSYREIFRGRTEVDLKDKWRNMTRYP